MSTDKNSLIWVEKYRPMTIDDCILPTRIKKQFNAMVKSGNLQNMMLVGSAGTGKTTVAQALCHEMGIDYLKINASEERNIDTIRTTVREYGSCYSLDGAMKCIILDEADNMTAAAQMALRGVIEEFAEVCRFIGTANYENRIIEPLRSRCPVIEFAYDDEEQFENGFKFTKRLEAILDVENVEYDVDQLMKIVADNAPDNRKTLNILQRACSTGVLEISSIKSIGDEDLSELISFCKDQEAGKMRQWVADNIGNDSVVLRRALYDGLKEYMHPQSIPECILILAKYQHMEAFVADREINTVAMLIEIMAECSFN